MYGISPFGTDPADDGLRPALRWESTVALVKTLAPGESTGYGRRFVATDADPDRDRPGRLRGRVPARHDRHGSSSSPASAHRSSERSRWTRSPSRLPDAAGEGDPVTLIGAGAPIEAHARVSGTIPYEIACGIVSRATRAEREIVDE